MNIKYKMYIIQDEYQIQDEYEIWTNDDYDKLVDRPSLKVAAWKGGWSVRTAKRLDPRATRELEAAQ